MNFVEMMTLEPHGPGTFVGVGPQYPWGGLYGGQIVAQGIRAAAETVDPAHHVHSVHAYFIRRGDHSEPIRFEIDRLRNGRSFVTRTVVARQATGAILNLAASFQIDEDDVAVQTEHMPAGVPAPDTVDDDSWTPMFERRSTPVDGEPRALGWLKMTEPIGDDPLLQACALAYLSDDLPMDAAFRAHPQPGTHGDFMSASLDHAIWFQRPVRADGWQLHDLSCRGLRGARGMVVGNIFDPAGDHLATVAQEVLLRRLR